MGYINMGKVDNKIKEEAGKISGKIGKGLLAGLAGTVGITAAQLIDMQLTDREPSTAPAEAAGKVLGVEPRGETDEKKEINTEKFSNIIHWAYGTSWGATRSLLSFAGIKGWKASVWQFTAIWGTAMFMLPALKVAPPVKKWGLGVIAKDALFHAVYAIVAGYVFDKLNEVKA